MAGSMSTYLEQKLLKHSLGVEAYTMPSPLYMSLHTGNPGEGNNHPTGGAELADGVGYGAGYARQGVTFGTRTDGGLETDPSICKNTNDDTFTGLPIAVITHIGIYDALTGGNLLYYTEMTTATTSALGDTFTFLADALEIRLG